MSKHKEGYTGSMKKKRNQHHTVRDKNITKLYSKCHEICALLAELLQFQLLTDTTVLHLSTLGRILNWIIPSKIPLHSKFHRRDEERDRNGLKEQLNDVNGMFEKGTWVEM